MKNEKLLFVFIICYFTSHSQTLCPDIASKGYGTHGPYKVEIDSIAHPSWPFHDVYIFKSQLYQKEMPAVLFCHGIKATHYSKYRKLLTTIASNGYFVVYSPHRFSVRKTEHREQYERMMSGFTAAVDSFHSLVDTSRIAVVGHSYGGGAVPSITWHLINDRHWGQNGSCMFIMGPWYMLSTTNEMLESFPDNVKMVVQIYADDRMYDNRIAIDIFNSIPLSRESKEFICVNSDKRFSCNLLANNYTPTNKDGASTVLQVNGVFRPLCALLDYSLKSDEGAAKYALGHGDTSQIAMGTWKDGTKVNPLSVWSNPEPLHPEHFFFHFWSNRINPRFEDSKDRSFVVQQSKPKLFSTIINYFKSGRHFYKVGRHDLKEKKKITGPVPPIDSGYGSSGPYTIITDSIPNPSSSVKPIQVYLPASRSGMIDSSKKYPIVFFAHGYTKSNPLVYHLIIENIVSHGVICVFVPYHTVWSISGRNGNYEILFNGFELAVKKFHEIVDTTRLGVAGHSFGAGATPWIMWKSIKEKNWGTSKAFMFMMAPWYIHEITAKQLAEFPSHVKLITEIYSDDKVNDHRMAADLFNRIGIPDSNKNFITIDSDTGFGYIFKADHSLPKSGWIEEGSEDGYDYYGVLRQLDALMDYAFNGNVLAKEIALSGGKNPLQRYMGKYPDGKAVKELKASFHAVIDSARQKQFLFKWDNLLNPFNRTDDKR